MRSIVAGIQIDADLKCEYEGHAFSIRAANGTIVVEVSDLITGIRLIRKFSRQNGSQFAPSQLNVWLELLDSTLEFRVDGICVANAGGESGSYLGYLIGFDRVRLQPLAVLRSALRGRR